MPVQSPAGQLVVAVVTVRDLTDRTRNLLAEMGRLGERYDSARLASALGLLSTAAGLLADASGELHQAYVVAEAAANRDVVQAPLATEWQLLTDDGTVVWTGADEPTQARVNRIGININNKGWNGVDLDLHHNGSFVRSVTPACTQE